MRFPPSRRGEIFRLNRKILQEGFPRLQMLFLVAITGASGFVASFVLLHSGVQAMPWRYLLACMAAYVVFLMLLWLWLRTKAEDYADIPDPGSAISSPGNGGGGVPYEGGGGEFGGGGASGSFDSASAACEPASFELPELSSPAEDVLEVASGADELAIPLFLAMLLAALLLSSLYVVYSAPMLFAELLLDGMLAAGLYRRLRGIPGRHWLETALRRTFWPFLLTALVAWVAGWAMQLYAPDADSLGEVLQYHATQEPDGLKDETIR